jgi:tetratricopeptide (TPR) repeat protein
MDPLEHIIDFLKKTDELKIASTLLVAFKKYAYNINQYDQLGKLFYEVKDYYSAIECAENTLAMARTPQEMYSTRCNLAKLYNSINEPTKALIYINANLTVKPDDTKMMLERILSYYLEGDFDKSCKLTEEIIADPSVSKEIIDNARFNMGTYLLDQNKFKQGLAGFIGVGHEIGIWPKNRLPNARWNGSVQPGATIAILAEGGIGDEVINVRFVKNIEALGMKAIFVTNKKDTFELFNRNNLRAVRTVAEVPEDAQWILAMYLPIVLDLDYNQLWSGPYLEPDAKYVEKWRKILPTGKKVAIRWRGNEYYDQDLHRSIPLDELHNVLDFNRTDITFVSVQRENFEGIEQYPRVINVADKLETLEDLLACLSLMDQTITSCTSVAHIAAAAGLNTTVCTPIATYYVWLGNSQWYGKNCKVIRQTKRKNWSHLKRVVI